MRYAQEDWERERSGWRTVVQLNIVRSIITILSVVEAELSGNMPVYLDDEGDSYPSVEPARFNDRHQLLMIRLAPLRGVETDLKRRLGAASELGQTPVPSEPMSATPFEVPMLDPTLSKRPAMEFSVRCWNDVVDPAAVKAHTGEDRLELDSSTITIAGCKNDMKALWTDKTVQLALARRQIRLPDSAGLYVVP